MTDSLPTDQIATPRTDAAKFTARERYCIYPGKDELVYADFARAQERRIDQLEDMCRQIAELISGHEGHVFDDISNVLVSTF